MEKKDSIFSGLSPAPVPAPASAPRSAAPDQEVAALRQKMEAMEKNILAHLDKKNSESRPAAPPPLPRPPEQGTQFLLGKIAELEKKLEDFARGAAVSSAQMRQIEESKAGARREIEELLKVVREQQKYSELDRQMHDQLEKSWRRVEELEKKLMDFYSSAALSRPGEAPARPPAPAAEGVEKIVDARLGKLTAQLDARFDLMADKLDAVLAAASPVPAEPVPGPAGLDELEKMINARLQVFLAAVDAKLAVLAAARAPAPGSAVKADAAGNAPEPVLRNFLAAFDRRNADNISSLNSLLDSRLSAFEARVRFLVRTLGL